MMLFIEYQFKEHDCVVSNAKYISVVIDAQLINV